MGTRPGASSIAIPRPILDLTGPLDPAAADALSARLHHVSLPAGSLLFRQGEPGEAAYFVLSGRVAASVRRDDGRDVRVGRVDPGACVGATALSSTEPRMATVRAIEDSELLRLSRSGYEALIQRASLARFADVMSRHLSRSARTRLALAAIRSTTALAPQELAGLSVAGGPVWPDRKVAELYHRIAIDLAVPLGAQDVNWFAFACHTSRTAGPTLRGEDRAVLPPPVRLAVRLVPDALVTRLRRWPLVRRLDARLLAVTARLADGYRTIAAELAVPFARLVTLCADPNPFDPARLDALTASLRPGPADSGGHDLIRDALHAYYEAAHATDDKTRAELVLLGTLRIALHEQTRLHPVIDDALERPVAALAAAFTPWARALPPAWRIEERVRATVLRMARQLITSRLVRVHIPYADLRRGDDLPRAVAEGRSPARLDSLEHPELAAMFARLDRRAASGRIDWSDLDDRMRYLATVFRSCQSRIELFEPPGSDEALDFLEGTGAVDPPQ